MAEDNNGGNGSPGPSTDRRNDPVRDPSRNVLDLVEAAIQRLDDLNKSESEHVRQLMHVYADHEKELRVAEAKRIDSIRAVDVQASQQNAKDAEIRAAALASTVAASAEAMRVQVAATASVASTTLTAALVPIQEAVADLRRVQYEQQGQRAQITEGRAGGANAGMWIGVAVGVVGLLLSLVVVVFATR